MYSWKSKFRVCIYASCRNTIARSRTINVVLKLFIKVLRKKSFPESVWLGLVRYLCCVYLRVSCLFSYMTLMQIVLTLTVQPALDYN